MKRGVKIIGSVLAVALVGVGVFLFVQSQRVPGPDVKTSTPEELRAYIVGDEFRTLSQRDKRRLLEAYVDKLKGYTFAQMLGLATRPVNEQEKFLRAALEVDGRDEIFAPLVGIFLDKFFEQPKDVRARQMMMIALANQAQVLSNPERFGLPPIDRFREDMHRFMAQQPVKTQAQMGQFLIDLQSTRQSMGFKDPF